MKYYSELTKKLYDTAKELNDAESLHKETLIEKETQLAEKKKRADEVTKAYEAIRNAEKEFIKLRNEFVKDYGSFHMTYRETGDKPILDLFDAFDGLFKNWRF